MKATTINTTHGPAAAQAVEHAEFVQYNCFLPPAGGAGVFMLVPHSLAPDQAADTFADILNAGPHAEDKDLTHLGNNIISAGSVNMAQINVSQEIRSTKE